MAKNDDDDKWIIRLKVRPEQPRLPPGAEGGGRFSKVGDTGKPATTVPGWKPGIPQSMAWGSVDDGDFETPVLKVPNGHKWQGRIHYDKPKKKYVAHYRVDSGKPRGHSGHDSADEAKAKLKESYERYVKTGHIA